MRRADRLFLLVQVLRAKRITTADELARELGVSKRTVYRDIRDLQASGVPVEGEAGVGYMLQRGFELPPMTFTPTELEALALGVRMVEAWGDPDLGAAARAVRTKVDAVLPSGLKPALAASALYAIPRHWGAAVTRDMAALRRAIRGHRKLAIHYEARDGQSTERVVWPLGLYFWGSTWTLAAWCEHREDYRSFRPDRIRQSAMLDATFDPGSGPSLPGFVAAMTARGERDASAP